MSANNTTEVDHYPTDPIRNFSLSKHIHGNTDPARDFIHPISTATWPHIRRSYQPYLSEFLGTLVVVLFGDSVVAQKHLSSGTAGSELSINAGWGLAVAFGIFASGKSGAHINPGVSIALAVFRGFDWRKVPGYIGAQLLGGLVGALLMYANYISAIDAFEGGQYIRTVSGPTATAGLFCTYPQPFLNKAGQFFSEFLASAVLMGGILAVTDRGNLGTQATLPAAVGMLIFAIGMCFGWETGYAINMARDFMPRVASWMVGYGWEVWWAGDYYFWVPIVAPILGMLFGGFLYDFLIYDGESPVNMPYMNFPVIYNSFFSLFPGQKQKITDIESGLSDKSDTDLVSSNRHQAPVVHPQPVVDPHTQELANFTFPIRRTSSVPVPAHLPPAEGDPGWGRVRTGNHGYSLSGATAVDSRPSI